jgi:hypothetical protein
MFQLVFCGAFVSLPNHATGGTGLCTGLAGCATTSGGGAAAKYRAKYSAKHSANNPACRAANPGP